MQMQSSDDIFYLCPQCEGTVSEATLASGKLFCKASCERRFDSQNHAHDLLKCYLLEWSTGLPVGRLDETLSKDPPKESDAFKKAWGKVLVMDTVPGLREKRLQNLYDLAKDPKLKQKFKVVLERLRTNAHQ